MKPMYDHYISLGFFCSVTLELERYGLRDSSYPFDWLITDFPGVIKMLQDGFQYFFEYDFFEQDKKDRRHYRNSYYNCEFYHDFSPKIPLSKQFIPFTDKYKRRIKRFINAIKEKTLFLRYVKNQEEIDYIFHNFDNILKTIQSYNLDNEICLLCNSDLDYSALRKIGLSVFLIDKDENDTVARHPFDKNNELQALFDIEYPTKEENLRFYLKKQQNLKKKQEGLQGLLKSFIRRIESLFYYRHDKEY